MIHRLVPVSMTLMTTVSLFHAEYFSMNSETVQDRDIVSLKHQ